MTKKFRIIYAGFAVFPSVAIKGTTSHLITQLRNPTDVVLFQGCALEPSCADKKLSQPLDENNKYHSILSTDETFRSITSSLKHATEMEKFQGRHRDALEVQVQERVKEPTGSFLERWFIEVKQRVRVRKAGRFQKL